MKAPNLIALTAAVLFTAATLSIVNTNVSYQPLAEINGTKVIDLAPIQVVPSAEERHAASLLGIASEAASGMATALGADAEHAAGLLGAQLAMPYYSFGSTFGRISKE